MTASQCVVTFTRKSPLEKNSSAFSFAHVNRCCRLFFFVALDHNEHCIAERNIYLNYTVFYLYFFIFYTHDFTLEKTNLFKCLRGYSVTLLESSGGRVSVLLSGW